MAKRLNPRAVKAVLTYTIPEAAHALGVTCGTVRAWIKQGLPAMIALRPYLILGADLRGFLADRAAKGRVKLAPEQLYCLTCKSPQTPLGMMLDFTPHSDTTGRLTGLCSVCGGIFNCMASRASLTRLGAIFDIACREGERP